MSQKVHVNSVHKIAIVEDSPLMRRFPKNNFRDKNDKTPFEITALSNKYYNSAIIRLK